MAEDELLAGRYRRLSVLGAGGMGEVWLAEDTVLDRRVAIKRLAAGLDADAEMLERIMREARLAARMDHPNAVTIHDVLVVDAKPHLVMQYVAGESLSEVLTRGPLPPTDAARIGTHVADALAAAHELGVVHRDVKPANILLDARGRVLLADFGIARSAADGRLTQTGTFIGTPSYLAPEIARGDVASAASDVYALGATLFAAVEGHAPFAADDTDNALVLLSRILTTPAPVPRRAGPLSGLITAMVAADPAQRPSAPVVAEALRRAIASTPPEPAGPDSVTIRAPRSTTPSVPPSAVTGDDDGEKPDDGEDPDDPLTTLIGALLHCQQITGGWSGDMDAWQRLLLDAVLPYLEHGDRVDAFVPTLVLPRGRPTSTGAELRAGATITTGDRLVSAWTSGGAWSRNRSVTIRYAAVRSLVETTYATDEAVRQCLVLEGEDFHWPIVFNSEPDLGHLRLLLAGRVRGTVRPVWEGARVSGFAVQARDGSWRTEPGWTPDQ